MTTKPELLDETPAAEYLGVKTHTLQIWRSTKRYDLPYIKVGRRVKYSRTALDDFLSRRTVNRPEAA